MNTKVSGSSLDDLTKQDRPKHAVYPEIAPAAKPVAIYLARCFERNNQWRNVKKAFFVRPNSKISLYR